MNYELLYPALQGIINAVDAIPGRKSRHVHKSVLDAVEMGRKVLQISQLTPASLARDLLRSIGVDNVAQLDTAVAGIYADTLMNHECFQSSQAEPPAGYVFPSKQRITLRGGPLDGCWYWGFISFQELAMENVMREVKAVGDDWYRFEYYSLPDSHGICYYRG